MECKELCSMNNQQNPYQQGSNPNYYFPQTSPAFYPYSPYFRQGEERQDNQGMLPMEQSYIENILRLNRGKTVTAYMTFDGSREWNSKKFTGVIEAAGRDHLILSQTGTGKRVLLLMIYLNYVE